MLSPPGAQKSESCSWKGKEKRLGSVGGEGKEGQRSRVTPGGGRERGGKKRWGKAINDIFPCLLQMLLLMLNVTKERLSLIFLLTDFTSDYCL